MTLVYYVQDPVSGENIQRRTARVSRVWLRCADGEGYITVAFPDGTVRTLPGVVVSEVREDS